MKTLFLLGDSVMKGVIYKGNLGLKSYALCDEATSAPFAEHGIELVNRSKMGATVEYCKENFNKLTHDLPGSGCNVLFSYGGNDSDFDWKAVSEAPTAHHDPKISAEEFRNIYRENIENARAEGARVVMTNLIPIDPDRYFDRITQGLNAYNILKWLGDKSMLYRWHEYYNSLVEKIAAECACPIIDVRSAFLLSHDYKSLICADGIHPTEEGHLLIRKTIAEAI